MKLSTARYVTPQSEVTVQGVCASEGMECPCTSQQCRTLHLPLTGEAVVCMPDLFSGLENSSFVISLHTITVTEETVSYLNALQSA